MDDATILVLEDDANLLNLYTRVLSKVGYHVYPAMTLTTARELLQQHEFDIFISDIGIGSLRSIELLRQEIDDLNNHKTIIIIVSGREEARYMCEEIGIEFFLHKPVSPSELKMLVERFLQRRVAVS